MTRQLQIYIQSATFHLTLSFLYFITIKIKISYHFDKKTNPVIHTPKLLYHFLLKFIIISAMVNNRNYCHTLA